MKVTTITTSRIELTVEETNILNNMMNFIDGIDTDAWKSLSEQWQNRLSDVYDTCFALTHLNE